MSLPAASETPDPESRFISSLPIIDRTVAAIGRRSRLAESEIEEFGSWAKARMVESGYAAFQKFGGLSSLSTYLNVVVQHLFTDYCNSQWGRWRPSAAAKRLGPLAIRFETLVYRDGYSALEAMAILEARGASRDELRRIAKLLPPRTRAQDVPLDAADGKADRDRADATIAEEERDALVRRAFGMVMSLIEALPPEDRLIAEMRLCRGMSVADIARALGRDDKPLYRRIDGILAKLREGLIALGIDQDAIREALDRESEH